MRRRAHQGFATAGERTYEAFYRSLWKNFCDLPARVGGGALPDGGAWGALCGSERDANADIRALLELFTPSMSCRAITDAHRPAIMRLAEGWRRRSDRCGTNKCSAAGRQAPRR